VISRTVSVDVYIIQCDSHCDIELKAGHVHLNQAWCSLHGLEEVRDSWATVTQHVRLWYRVLMETHCLSWQTTLIQLLVFVRDQHHIFHLKTGTERRWQRQRKWIRKGEQGRGGNIVYTTFLPSCFPQNS